MLEDVAPAKINLTLVVHGRRGDGYHELDSLVVFTAFGDRVALWPGGELSVTTRGPFATAITDDNLIAKAVRGARRAQPRLEAGHFVLDKLIPVAAGLGGGSSDAAAALRLLQRRNPDLVATLDWSAVAAACGADVPVCLAMQSSRMQGLGDRVAPVSGVPPLGCVLVNPRVPLSTADVFRALRAAPVGTIEEGGFPARFTGRDDLIAFVRDGRNDLEPVAIGLCPPIGAVKAVLASAPGCRVARMSGSGPTCFGLFDTQDEAQVAVAHLLGRYPAWWAVATRLAG